MPTETLTDSRRAGRNTTHVVVEPEGLAIHKRFDGLAADRQRRFDNTLSWQRVQDDHGLHLAPEITRVDRDTWAIWFDYLDSAQTLQAFIDARAEWSDLTAVLHDCGAAIAGAHGIPLPAGRPESATPSDLGGVDPLALFTALTPEQYAEASGAELECWSLFHHDEVLRDALRRWVDAQVHDPVGGVIHGDLRPDQYLIDEQGVHIIDWEEWGPGAFTRDLAGVLGPMLFEALVTGVGATGQAGGLPGEMHAALVARTHAALVAFTPAVRAFLTGYAVGGGRGIDSRRLGQDLGWALIERVLARAAMSHRLPAVDKAVAGIGRQALVSPESIVAALGLESVDEPR